MRVRERANFLIRDHGLNGRQIDDALVKEGFFTIEFSGSITNEIVDWLYDHVDVIDWLVRGNRFFFTESHIAVQFRLTFT